MGNERKPSIPTFPTSLPPTPSILTSANFQFSIPRPRTKKDTAGLFISRFSSRAARRMRCRLLGGLAVAIGVKKSLTPIGHFGIQNRAQRIDTACGFSIHRPRRRGTLLPWVASVFVRVTLSKGEFSTQRRDRVRAVSVVLPAPLDYK